MALTKFKNYIQKNLTWLLSNILENKGRRTPSPRSASLRYLTSQKKKQKERNKNNNSVINSKNTENC
jgi:hypothetical protein